MDNYILKAEDDVINQEALNLFKKLGYRFSENDRSGMIYTLNGSVSCDRLEFWDYYRETEGCKEITLSNLRMLAGDCHPQDPALISGAEAKLAWAKGIDLQINKKDTHFGFIDMSNDYSLGVFDNEDYEFRLKPQTIKLELELPKPFEPKDGQRYFYLNPHADAGYGVNTTTKWNKYLQFGAWRTEEEIKQVVEHLRKIRGTNS